ncbi:MAG: hypothetical protein ABIB61_01570 [Candidatus Shapirobacteria bacterium]
MLKSKIRAEKKLHSSRGLFLSPETKGHLSACSYAYDLVREDIVAYRIVTLEKTNQ